MSSPIRRTSRFSPEVIAARRAALPRPEFPEDLPVSARRGEIAQAILDNQIVIVCGETGSGKTTQLPKICLELGRGSLLEVVENHEDRAPVRRVALKESRKAGDAHRHGKNRKDILRAHKTAVEKRQTGQCHEKHKCRAGHLPRVVAGAGAGDLRDDIGSSGSVVHIRLQVGETLLDTWFSGGLGRRGRGFDDGGSRCLFDECGRCFLCQSRRQTQGARRNDGCGDVCQCFSF